MMDFLDKKIKGKKQIGTPTKKRKLNQQQQIHAEVEDFQIPFSNLIFIRNISNISNNQSFQTNRKDKGQRQPFQIISDFTSGQQANCKHSKENKQNNMNQMNRKMSEQQGQLKIPFKMSKKHTLVQKYNSEQYDQLLTQLSLTKNNSTFPITKFIDQDNQEIGENVYLTQLLTLKSKISLTQVNNKNRQILRETKNSQQQCSLTQNRLQKDFQIKQNLFKYHSKKQGYICLNKLQKIFYFVKKIKLFTNNQPQNYFNNIEKKENFDSKLNKINAHQLQYYKLQQSKPQITNQNTIKQVSDQIKLYNKDSQGHLVRFYREWMQNNSIYMIYELGSYSIKDKNMESKKLPQNQVWSVIYDIGSTLKWVHQNQKVHLNIKPGNIIKCRSKYKLSDPFVTVDNFKQYLQTINTSGLSTNDSNSLYNLTSSHLKNTKQVYEQMFYLAPELIQFKSFLDGIEFFKSQIYSLGLCILQNITTMPSSMRTKPIKEIKHYFKKQLHGYSSCLKKLLFRMIETNFKLRPSLQELTPKDMQEFQQISDGIKNDLKFKRLNSI